MKKRKLFRTNELIISYKRVSNSFVRIFRILTNY